MQSRIVLAAVIVVLVSGSLPFTISVSSQPPAEAVSFDQTKSVGVPSTVVREAQRTGMVLPKAQVFYSQYRYIVGYYGITSLLASMQTGQDRSLGRPLTIYVTDFSGTNVSVNKEGKLWIPETSPQTTDWVAATNAYFVVNSTATIPTRETAVVPFSTRQDAEAFADEYGGEIQRWERVKRLPVRELMRTQAEWQRDVQQRHQRANNTVSTGRVLLDRPVSLIVGEDAPTLQAAISRAAPNTTVIVPPGTYNVTTLQLRKPLTLRGSGPNVTRIVGNRNGSVLSAHAPKTAISNLSIRGIGQNRSGANRTPNEVQVDKNATLYNMRKVHGYGDAAIVFDTAQSSVVTNVTINTTSNGVIARDSPNVSITNLTVYGTKRWQNGFLGVSAVGSSIVVQDSQFYGGKVGVYSLDVTDVVVRDSFMEGMMVGSFNLYGRKLLVANNTIEDTNFGIYVETRSYNTAVVENTVLNSGNGLIVEGTANYVGKNVAAKNAQGMEVEGRYTLYTRNVLGFNTVGFQSGELLATNRVTANDVVANRWPAEVSAHNVLHVWRGNYWSSAPGIRQTTTGHLRRAFYPTGAVDRVVDKVPYAPTLAQSPALTVIRQLRRLVPGLQVSGIVDPTPRAQPARPPTVARLRTTYESSGQTNDDDPWDYQTE